MYVYIYTHIDTYIYINTPIIYTHIHTYIYIRTFIAHVPTWCVKKDEWVKCIYAYVHVDTYIYIHAYIYIYLYRPCAHLTCEKRNGSKETYQRNTIKWWLLGGMAHPLAPMCPPDVSKKKWVKCMCIYKHRGREMYVYIYIHIYIYIPLAPMGPPGMSQRTCMSKETSK